MTTPPDDELGYEQARDELVAVVQRLETGGVGLEESLALWERGEQLAAICQQRLDGARSRLETARERQGDTARERQADDQPSGSSDDT